MDVTVGVILKYALELIDAWNVLNNPPQCTLSSVSSFLPGKPGVSVQACDKGQCLKLIGRTWTTYDALVTSKTLYLSR